MMKWQARDPSKIRKAAYIALPILILVLIFSAYIPSVQNVWKAFQRAADLVPFAESFPHDGLHVHVIDVGKADAIFIETEKTAVLVDAGTHEQAVKIQNYLAARGIDRLDLLILSHGDSDHVGGAAQLLKNMPTEDVICSAYSSAAIDFPMAVCVQTGNVLEYEDIQLEILAPDSAFGSENDNSLVFRLRYEGFSMLFCGDIESKAEELLLENRNDLQADVLKVAHHGSNSSSSEMFLKAVSPKYAVISSGEDGSMLPRNIVLQR